jgi:uracil-DNA glycosylase
MAESVQKLIAAMEAEARREPFPIDEPVYRAAGLEPTTVILYAGSLDAEVGFIARDLGRDEVRHRQPLVGAAGRLVREGVWRALGHKGKPTREDLQAVLEHVLLTNTVPWKPPGNKAYSEAVKNRFRPFVMRFLARHWKGHYLVTLGTEAFLYFAPYAEKGALEAFWKRADKYEREIEVTVPSGTGGVAEKTLTLAPLPHPSPLNKRFYDAFPAMLDKRLKGRF